MAHIIRSFRWIRWILFSAGLLCLAAGIWWLFGAPPFDEMHLAGTPACWGLFFVEPDGWAMVFNSSTYLGVLLIAQWAFLRPRQRWGMRLAQKGRPMKSAIVAAALMGMLLSVGFIATLLELPHWWESVFEHPFGLYGAWIAMVAVWIIWALVFFLYWRRGDRYTQLSRMVHGLVAGSVLELLVAIPIQASRSSADNCYCERGSYTGVVFGVTVLLWAFGPGIALMVMGERARRSNPKRNLKN